MFTNSGGTKMDILNQLIFGEYIPFWRAIKINDSIINEFEAKNQIYYILL
jgi:hypothetical protein